MRMRGQLTVLVAVCMGACSTGEPDRAGTAAEKVPAPAGAVTLAATPPMGFNTWNRFGCDVSDELVRGIADAMVESGMKAVSYTHLRAHET